MSDFKSVMLDRKKLQFNDIFDHWTIFNFFNHTQTSDIFHSIWSYVKCPFIALFKQYSSTESCWMLMWRMWVIFASRWHVLVLWEEARAERLKLTLPAGVSLQLSASRRQSFSPHSHVQRRRYQTIRPSRGVPLGLRKRAEKGTGSCVWTLFSLLVSAV